MSLPQRLPLAAPLAILAAGATALPAQLLGPGWLAPLPATTVTGSQALARLARQLRRNPNDPELHLRTAEAYFARGAQEDAQRVRRHLERAVQLDPDLDREVGTAIRRFRSGTQAAARTPTQRRVDEVIRESVPLIEAPPEGEGPDPRAVIEAGLATRMLERDHDRRLTSLADARDQFAGLFDFDSDKEGGERWGRRFEELRGRRPVPGWEGAWQEAVERTVRRNLERERDAGGPRLRPQAEVVEDFEGEAIPDPMDAKDLAVLAFHQDDLPRAVELLTETVASVEVRRNIDLVSGIAEEEEDEADDEVLVEDQFGGQETAGGGRDPGGQPSSGETSEGQELPGDPDQPGGPPGSEGQPLRPPPLAPQQAREIGETALQTLEAMENPDVPPHVVDQKVAELAAIGQVGDPLLIDLDGDGVPAIAGGLLPDGELDPRALVRFDLDGDGYPEWTEWTLPGADGLLAVDLDGDGVVTSGRELFGTAHGDPHGFARLQVYDVDGDGWIQGPETRPLRVWVDDGDGRCEPSELESLAVRGILAIQAVHLDGTSRARTLAGPRTVWEWMPDTRAGNLEARPLD